MHLLWIALFLISLGNLWAADINLPSPPELSLAGRQLILNYEVGGGEAYYDNFLIHPEWPGLQSGVTVGIGYDCGYNDSEVILRDWSRIVENKRLAATSGITGFRARDLAHDLRFVTIRWEDADAVFETVTLAKFYELTRYAFPGLEELHPNAQAALISLVFNRGSSLYGPSRREMRIIRDLVPQKDYQAIADQIRSMKRLWPETKGLRLRREAEANLIESCKG